MKPTRSIAAALTLAALFSGTGIAARAAGQGQQDDPFEKLKSYDFQSRASVAAIQQMIQQSLPDKAQTAQIEEKLDAVLNDPSASFAGKQEACRFLWIIGSVRSVPTLTKMLNDEKLSDMARYALERDADPSAGRALRAAAVTTTGKTQIGIINSIGDRGDAEGAAVLKPFVTNADPLLAEAAIAALGKIGTESAVATLRALPATNLSAAHAMIRAAEHLAATGKKAESERIFEGLAGAGHPELIRAEAVRGLAAINSPRAGTVALSALKSSDPYLQQVSARICGSMTDPKTTAQCIALWPSLPVPTQVVLLTALADRHETAAMPLAISAAASKEPTLRVVGIQTEGKIGGAKAVPRLVDILLHGEGQDRNIARVSLAAMPGADSEQAILQLARQGPPEARAALMGVLTDRPTHAAITVLMETAQGTDDRAAVEALRALGRVGGPKEHPELIKLLVSTKSDAVRDAAKEAVVYIGQRLPDRDQAAQPILAALNGASASSRAALLPALAETGGDRALEELTKSAGSSDPDVKQAAIRALAETWSDSRALPTLLSIAKTDSNKGTRVQALRGYLRLLGQDEQMSAADKVDNLGQAIKAAERPEEKRQALSVLRDVRTPEAMAMAAQLLNDNDLFAEAADTVLYLAAPQRKNNRNQRAVKGPEATAALDKVIQMTKDDSQRAKAQKLR